MPLSFPVSLAAYAAHWGDLTHPVAIAHARGAGLALCKHNDPLDDARRDLSDEDARTLALADVGLVYVDMPRAERLVDLFLLEDGALIRSSWDTSTEAGLDALLAHVASKVDRDPDGGALVVFGVIAHPGQVAHIRKSGALVGLLVAR